VFFSDLAVPNGDRRGRVDEPENYWIALPRWHHPRYDRSWYFQARLFPFGSAGMDDRGVARLCRTCSSIGVTLLAENIDYPRCGRSWVEARSAGYLPGGRLSGFRLIYDAGCSLAVNEDPLATLQVMAPYLAHVHVKNSRL